MSKLYTSTYLDGEGGTLLKGKTTGKINYEKCHTVGTINLIRLIDHPDLQCDYRVLKMNIEGGEYELMSMMLEEGLIEYFDQIYIQTDAHKLDPKKHNEYRILEQDFRKACLADNVDLFMQDKGMARFQCKGGAA